LTNEEKVMNDDIRDMLERGWRAVQGIDEALSRGEIDEAAWYKSMQDLIIPKYIAADNPRAQSGHSGDAAAWERARSLVVEGIDRHGSFLDAGCANGHLMETAQSWASERGSRVEPYGVDLSPVMIDLALRRLPQWHDRFWVANVLDWEAPRRFDFVHVQHLDYVPLTRRRELLAHLLTRICEPGGRLIIGPFNEIKAERATERIVTEWGYTIVGQAERHHMHPDIAYRAFWIDAA
ncbi:MAG TPA: class I SAM-dependent methyltransferase, partial [Blastocatellia bacterium]|nr:class I SAM-dependent methyltransferase [Blastocatellia bacterium]